MRDANSINPLTAPVMDGDEIEIGGRVYKARTNMRCTWDVLVDGRTVAGDLASQAALCSWLINEADAGATA